MNGTTLTLGLVGALAAASALTRRGSSAKRERITLGKMTGPSDERSAPVLLDGQEIGEITFRKMIRFRPAKRIDFDSADVVLWEPYDLDASFSSHEGYDAESSKKAALAQIRKHVLGASA
jgi:hypothetical protein